MFGKVNMRVAGKVWCTSSNDSDTPLSDDFALPINPTLPSRISEIIHFNQFFLVIIT